MAELTLKAILKQIYIVIFTLIFLVLFPVVLVLFLPIYLFRYIVSIFARIFRPDLGKLIATRSSVLSQDDAYNSPRWNLCVWLVLEGNLNLDQFRHEFLRDFLDKKKEDRHGSVRNYANPEFQQYFETFCGFQFWKWDSSFNVKNHIRYYFEEKEDKLTKETTEEELRQIIKELTWKKFTDKRSPWEMLFVPNYKSESDESKAEPKSVLLIRFHHGLMDGYSVLRLLMKEINGIELDYVARPHYVKRNIFVRLFIAFLFWVRAPYQFFRMLVQGNDVNDWHQIPEEKLIKPMNSAFTKRIPLSYIKDIKDSYKVSFTAVIMAAVTGGIRRMMLDTGDGIIGKIPKNMTTAIACPMHHPNLLHRPFKPRNHFIFSFVKLPVGVSDCRQRLFKMEKNLRELRRSTVPLLNFGFVPLVGALFEAMMPPFNTNVFSTVLLSNFPGPPKTAYFIMGGGNHRVTDMNFSAGFGRGQVGIGFCMMSYDEGIRIISEADRGILQNDAVVDILNKKILEELDELKHQSLI